MDRSLQALQAGDQLEETGLTSMAVQVVKILKQPLSWIPQCFLTLPLPPGGHIDPPYNASTKDQCSIQQSPQGMGSRAMVRLNSDWSLTVPYWWSNT